MVLGKLSDPVLKLLDLFVERVVCNHVLQLLRVQLEVLQMRKSQ